ncbi:MAG: hypothetical protein JXJ19_10200 [Elusimicrobia bacterium]|nr:hypothetical protein [Elusimicrobiota bacterium]
MKQKLILSVLILICGCASLPDPPDITVAGVMDISISGPADIRYPHMRGIFKVESDPGRFYLYLQDDYDLPGGKIIAEKGKVLEITVPMQKRFGKIFRYWPYLFASPEDAPAKWIEYLEWTEIDGKKLPAKLKIDSEEIMATISIYYGD